MKKRVRIQEIASKALMLVVAFCLLSSGVLYLDGQASALPENPLSGLWERDRMSVAEAATLEVDDEVLSDDAKVTDASSEQPSDDASINEVYAGEANGAATQGGQSGENSGEGLEGGGGLSEIEIILNPDRGSYFTWYEATYDFTAYTNPLDIDSFWIKHCGTSGKDKYIFGGGAEGHDYRVNLDFGVNTIKIYADSKELGQAYREITIVRQRPDGIRVTTDLGEYGVVNQPNISFYVAIQGANPGYTYSVKQVWGASSRTLYPSHSEALVDEMGRDYTKYYFDANLEILGGTQFIIAVDDYVNERVTWGPHTITYARENLPGPPELEPVVNHNVQDGMEVDRAVYTYKISAVDSKGAQIYDNSIYVYLNGVRCGVSEVYEPVYYYLLYLNEGKNTLYVKVYIAEEYYYEYTYTIYYTPSAGGETLGSVYVSAEASCVGLGTLASGEVPIYSDEPVSYAVVRMLERAGYECNVTGSLNYNMYLKHIYKPGITNGWSVAPELLDELTATFPDCWHGQYYVDSLGEGSFTSSSSGWMVTVNGSQVGGLSNYYPAAGDVIRIRFTLAGGRDIGLAGSNNFSQEW